jgi:polysaccharide chain length determinant protein (PEP-CTERM system associated)
MQPTENFNIPRRALDVEDYIDVLRRHKGWVFGPFLLTLVASVVGVYFYPDSYESVGVVKIVPQQVPQNMVQASITQDMTDSINSMSTTVLSRNVLTTIINNFDLYKNERKRLPMEDVVDNLMRKSLRVDPYLASANGRYVPAFTVQFTYQNRFLANKVTQEVMSRFITASVSDRSNATSETTGFLQDERDRAKKDLDALEEKVSQFRAENNGRLPDQMDMNSRTLQGLQTNYQFLTSSKSRADMEKLTNETNLRVEKSRKDAMEKEAPVNAATAAAAKSDRVLDIDREIRTLEDGLSVALQRYTEAHPDVQNLKGRLEVARDRRQKIIKEEAENKQPVAAPVANRQLQMQVLEVEGNIQRLESAGRAKELEIAELESEIKQVQTSINKVQAQISTAPLGEQRYGDLLRERDLASARYKDLDGRLNSAQLSQNLESRGQGQKLELLDAASLPQNPSEPKRPMVIGMGAGLGLLLGLVIAGAREMKDTSLKNLKDVRAYTQMAILGSVPLLENDFVVRRRKRMAWLGWTTACLVAVVTMAGSIVFYYYRNNA